MIGSPAVGALVAQLAFWILVIFGTINGTLSKIAAAVFLLLWVAGYLVLPRVASWSGPMVTPWVAVLDIVLVFLVAKGDIRFT
jgi:hypothetical protein